MINFKFFLLVLLTINFPFSTRVIANNSVVQYQLSSKNKTIPPNNLVIQKKTKFERKTNNYVGIVKRHKNEKNSILRNSKSHIITNEINNYSITGFKKPVCGFVNSKFGRRNGGNHCGIDLQLRTGDTVYASKNGVVRYSQYHNGGYGNLIVITHDNQVETYYAHLNKFLVSSKSIVKLGQAIGLGGSTGRSTGPHLHFETRVGGIPINPENFIYFGGKNKLKKLENKVKIVDENLISLDESKNLTINLKRKVCLIWNSISKSTGFIANLRYIGDSLSKEQVPKVLSINVNDTYVNGALLPSNSITKNRIGSYVPIQISFQREGSKKVEVISANLKVIN